MPLDPTKTGFTFGGWYLDENYTKEFSKNTTILANTIVYAKWTINEYTVTFDVNGGSELPIETQTVFKYYSKLTAPTQPTRHYNTILGIYNQRE